MRTDIAALLAAAAVLPAAAQTGPYYLALGQSLYHESNLQRLADGAAAPAGTTRGDTVSITSLLAGVDQRISRQRLRADAVLRASRFRHNEAYDNQGHGLRLAWEGSTAGRLSGSAGVNLDRSLTRTDAGFSSSAIDRNLTTTRQADAALRWGLATGWSAEIGSTHTRVDYSAAAFDPREYRQTSLAAAARWASGAALSAGLGLRSVRGEYPRFARDLFTGAFVADRFEGRYADLTLRWSGSVHQFDGRLSVGETSFDRDTAADLSGLTGALAWTWRPSGKLRLETRALRDRGQESSAIGYFITSGNQVVSGRYADFSRVATSLGSTLTWSATAKLGVTASALVVRRDLRSTGAGQAALRGEDRTRYLTLGARWQASRTIVLGCDIGHERRTSDQPQLSTDLANRTRSCFGQVAIS